MRVVDGAYNKCLTSASAEKYHVNWILQQAAYTLQGFLFSFLAFAAREK